MNPLLSIEQLVFRAHRHRVLFRGLDLKVMPGEVLIVSGPNGSGKTTLLRLIEGKLKPEMGKIVLSVPQRELGVLPQMQNMDFHLPLRLKEVIDVTQNRGVPMEEILKFNLLREEDLKLNWDTASGGERQRTLLTTVLLYNPTLLLLDEPLNHLDTYSREILLKGLKHYLDNNPNKGMVIISHQAGEKLKQLGSRVNEILLGRDD